MTEVAIAGAGGRMLRQLLFGTAISVCNIAIHALVMTAIMRVARIASARATDRQWLRLTTVMIATVLHSVRMAAPKRSRWRGATFATIRSVFVKLAVRVEELKRSIKLAFPRHLPHADALALVSGSHSAEGS
jgi:hypothetical protein